MGQTQDDKGKRSDFVARHEERLRRVDSALSRLRETAKASRALARRKPTRQAR